LTTDWPVYGHTHVIAALQQTLQRGDAPYHANLFLGPRQVGKSTVVHAFAQAILCTDEVRRPCGNCRACRLMSRASHPDFRLLQPLDKNGAVDRLNGTLRAEQAAELIHDAALRPVESRYKVFLIQDFHNANDTFANKLLKTLEEPPEPIVLCLTATDRSQLLPTIVSRCRLTELRPLPPPLIAQALQARWQAPPEQATLLARLSNGRLGWAVDQLSHPDSQQTRLGHLQTLWQLLAADRIERLALAEQLASNRNNQQLFGLLEIWLTWWRDLLLVQTGCAGQCANIDQQARLIQQATQISLADTQHYLGLLRQVEGYLHHTVNTRLALDVLLLHMPRVTGELSA
jgi:DNA polymerase-3 subunit delta'